MARVLVKKKAFHMSIAGKKSSKRITRNKSTPLGRSRPVTAKKQPSGAKQMTTAGEMAAYGIKRVPVDYFYFRDFRYTSLSDALAQAKRAVRD